MTDDDTTFDPLTYKVHNYRDDFYFSGHPTQMWPDAIEVMDMWDEIKRDTVALHEQLVQLRDEVRATPGDDDDEIAESSEAEKAAFERGRDYQQRAIATWIRHNQDILYARQIAAQINAGDYEDGVSGDYS